MNADAALDALAQALAPHLAREVVALLRTGETPGMVDQTASPLGRRRHINAVRKRVAEGAPGAAIVGRRFLLAREHVDAELAATSAKSKRKRAKVAAAAEPSLHERYGLRRVK